VFVDRSLIKTANPTLRVKRKMHNGTPFVTAVIPPRNRSDLVVRAVRSSLNQSFNDLEVVVVIDGPDPATVERLAEIDDERLHVIELPESVGGSEARNAGVRAARGEWIAFLDDDDEWLPTKIARQLDLALKSRSRFPVIATRMLGRTQNCDFLIPRRLPEPDECLSEYLFNRSSLFRGEAQLQTSMLFINRELLLVVPFTSGLRRHQDTEWYLRIAQTTGVSVEFVPEPLGIWYLDENRKRIGTTNNWEYSLGWLRANKCRMTSRAYAGFIATQLGPEGDWNAFPLLLREMLSNGKPKPIDLAIYFGVWLVPRRLRLIIRSYIHRSKSQSPSDHADRSG